ncbi:MAG: hypothetical protein PHD56_11940 [Anaerostipes sp.]|nr:hypothetical protein [Anaerostipes sp.]
MRKYTKVTAGILSLVMAFTMQGMTGFGMTKVMAAAQTVTIPGSLTNGDKADYSVTENSIVLKTTGKIYEFENSTYSGRNIKVEGDDIGISLNNTKITGTSSESEEVKNMKGVITVPKDKKVVITSKGTNSIGVADNSNINMSAGIVSDGDLTINGEGEVNIKGGQIYRSTSTTTYEGNVNINTKGRVGEREEAISGAGSIEIKGKVHLTCTSSCKESSYANAIGLDGIDGKPTTLTIGGSSKVELTSGEKGDNTHEDGYGIAGDSDSQLCIKDNAQVTSYTENSTNINAGKITIWDSAVCNLNTQKGAADDSAICLIYLDSCSITGNAAVNMTTAGAGLYDHNNAKSPLEIGGNAKVTVKGTGEYPSVLLNAAGLKMTDSAYLYTESANSKGIKTKTLDMSGSSKFVPVSTSGKLEAYVATDLNMSEKASILPQGTKKEIQVDGNVKVTGGTLDLNTLTVKGSVSITGGDSSIVNSVISQDKKDVILLIKLSGNNSSEVIAPTSAKVEQTVNVKVKDGYEIESITVNGSKKNGTSFVTPDKITNLVVNAKKKTAPETPTTTKKVSITKASISKIKSTTYTGYKKKPSVTVKYNNKKLKNGTDYTLSYKNNTKAGTAKVYIKGKGKYTGTKTVTFKIKTRKKGTYAKGIYKVASSGLKGRAKASSNSKVKKVFKKGTKLEATKVIKKKTSKKTYVWLKVKYKGKTYYVYGKYVR